MKFSITGAVHRGRVSAADIEFVDYPGLVFVVVLNGFRFHGLIYNSYGK